MTCDVIATGSKGNAVLLDGRILIDCGVPFSKIQPYIKDLEFVVLTHIHGDHFYPNTLLRIHRIRPAVRFVCGPNLLAELLNLGICAYSVYVATPLFPKRFVPAKDGEAITFSPVALVHNVENYGWLISFGTRRNDGTAVFRALYATDTRYIPREFPGLDLYMVERNHTREDLERRQEARKASGEFSHEDIVAAVHMSAETVDEWLSRNAGSNSRVVFLHGHKEAGEC